MHEPEIPQSSDMARYIKVFMDLPNSPDKEAISKAMVEDAGKLVDKGAAVYGPYFLMVMFSVAMSRANAAIWDANPEDAKAVISGFNLIIESYCTRKM